MYVQVGDSLVTTFIAAFYRSYIMTGFPVAMCSDGITFGIVYLNVTIRLYGYFGAAITEVPDLAAVSSTERTHLEGDFVTGFNIERGVIGRVDSGR